jgi:tRNA pseudouridine55 synthase
MVKDGILIANKPGGMTSHDVVDRFRSILREKRIGHTGTLDPDATGVLVLAVGRATRLIPFLPLDEKEYEAGIALGVSTDTYDASGRRTGPDRSDDVPDEKTVKEALGKFQGEIEQVPPMVSAVKVGGKRLYRLAREGAEVPRPARRVTIKEIEQLYFHPPEIGVRLVCSAGTYVRTLAHDLGERLGIGAHLSRLVRLRVGPYSIGDALPEEEWERLQRPEFREKTFVSMTAALNHLPVWTVPESQVRSIMNGMRIDQVDDPGEMKKAPDGFVSVCLPSGELIAVARKETGSGGTVSVSPVRVFKNGDPVGTGAR